MPRERDSRNSIGYGSARCRLHEIGKGRQRAVGSVTGSNGSDCERHASHCAVFISRFFH